MKCPEIHRFSRIVLSEHSISIVGIGINMSRLLGLGLSLLEPAQILLRLSKLCVQEGSSGRKSKKQHQRLLRNMGAHAVVLELLQIPYEKV